MVQGCDCFPRAAPHLPTSPHPEDSSAFSRPARDTAGGLLGILGEPHGSLLTAKTWMPPAMAPPAQRALCLFVCPVAASVPSATFGDYSGASQGPLAELHVVVICLCLLSTARHLLLTGTDRCYPHILCSECLHCPGLGSPASWASCQRSPVSSPSRTAPNSVAPLCHPSLC